MKNESNTIEKIRNLLSSKESLEAVFKELLQLKGRKGNLLPLLKGNFLSEKRDFNQGIISHEEFKRYENKTRLALMEIVDNLECETKFVILNSPELRTKKIIEDLEELYKREKFNDLVVWSVAFLSIFAIGDDKNFVKTKKEKDLIGLLEQEKQLLLNLAAAGCEIRCIICPANPKNVSENLDYAKYRTSQLIDFLNNKNDNKEERQLVESALENIYWATTDYPQRNVYVIGDISFFEGYKKGNEPFGFGLTSRQTYNEVISSNSKLYDNFFDELSCKNLYNPDWKDKEAIKDTGPTSLRRESVIFKLEESLDFLNTIISQKK